MGLTHAKIELRNPRLPDLAPVEIEALADTGAVHTCIPSHVQVQLQLPEADVKEVVLADGSLRLVPYVGPIELRYLNRVGLAARWSWGSSRCWASSPWKTWTWSSCRKPGTSS